MALDQELFLRIQFVKQKKFDRFVIDLKKDNVMSQYFAETIEKSVLFKFENKEMRDFCFETFKDSIQSAKEKTTKRGYNYIKVYK